MQNTPSILKRFPRRKLCMLLLSALPVLQVQADTYLWTGSSSNDINDAGNWVLTSADGSGTDFLVINQNTSVAGTPQWEINNNSGSSLTPTPSGYASGLLVGQGSGSNGTLNIFRSDTDAEWAVGNVQSLQVGVEGGQGLVNIYQNDSYIQTSSSTTLRVNDFTIGSGTGSQGTVNVLGSGKTQSMQGYNGATFMFQGSGADVSIGIDGGQGILNVDGGSVSLETNQNRFVLGSGTGSVGTVNVLGGGKVMHNWQPYAQNEIVAVIGDNGGQGILNISGQSATNSAISRAVFATGLTVGQDTGSVGQINLAQGGQLLTAAAQYWDSDTSDYKLTPIQLGVNGGTGQAVIDGTNTAWRVVGPTYFSGGNIGAIGELHVGVSGTGEVTVANGGTLSIGQVQYDYQSGSSGDYWYSYYAETAYNGGLGTLYLADEAGSVGIINIGAAAGQAAQGTGSLDIKDIRFGAGEGIIVFNHTDDSGSYIFDTPLISGSGQGTIRQLAGTTILADEPDYSGDISVEGGKLIINGTQTIGNSSVSGGIFEVNGTYTTNSTQVSGGMLEVNGTYTANDIQVSGGYLEVAGLVHGPVSISGSGTLSGNGVLSSAVTVESGGTVSPGVPSTSLETITVGSITFNPGSVYQSQSNPDGTTDLIYATTAYGGSGTAIINGGAVNIISAAANWAQDTKYPIIRTDSGVSGQFDSITSNLAFLTPGLEYDASNVYLYFTRNDTGFGEVGDTHNQTNTGEGIQSQDQGNPVHDSIVSMSAEEARSAYDNLSGEIYASAQSAILANSRYARTAIIGHLDVREQEPRKNLWLDTWGHKGHFKNDGNAARLDNKSWGFLIGSDVYTDGVSTAGIAAGYERTRLSLGDGRHSDADIDAAHLMVYGRTTIGPIDLKGGVGHSWLSIDTSRNITVPGLTAKNEASYNGRLTQVFAQASHTFEITDTAGLIPYLGLNYQHLKMDSFTENGGDARLHSSSQSKNMSSSTVGVKGQWTVHDTTLLSADIGWQHNFGGMTPGVNLSFTGGGTYHIKGVKMNRDSMLIGAGAAFALRNNMSLSVRYEGSYGNGGWDHAGRLLWQLRF